MAGVSMAGPGDRVSADCHYIAGARKRIERLQRETI